MPNYAREQRAGRGSEPGRCGAARRAAGLLAACALAAAALFAAAAPADAQTVTIAADAALYGYEIDDVFFTLTRTGATTAALTVNVTMTQADQYLRSAHLNSTATFAIGSTTAGLSFQRFQFQPGGATQSGNLTATVATGTGYTVGMPASASTRMVVLNPAVTVRLERAAYRFEEGTGGAEVVLVARTEPGLPRPNRTFQVSLLSRAQTASSVTDYTSLTEQVDILAADFVAVGNVWEARKGVAVVIADDTTDESDETFDVYLSAGPALPTRAHVVRTDGTACPSTTGGAACASTATIVDDDGTPAAVRNLSFMPADGAVAVSWELPSDDGGSAVTGLQYRVSGDGGTTWSPDWTAIADGTDAGSDVADETAVTVSGLANGTVHTFAVRALNANGNGTTADGTATPLAPVTVTVAAAAGAYGHELDQVEYTLTRTGATAGTLTVNVTMTQEQSYLGTAHLSQQVAFSAGATTAGLSFQSFQYQPGGATQSGNLTANVATGTGYNVGTPASASTRMVVLDPAVKVRLERASYRFEEGAGGAQVVLVARTEPGLPRPNRTFQVSLLSQEQTASSGTDYTSLSEQVDILAADFVAVGNVWEARKGVAVVIADDATDESDETFDVYLSAGTALPARAHVVRADGNACPSTTGGAACAVTATIVDDDGTPAAVRNLSFMPADGAVAVSWELPSDDGGSAVTGLQYRVSDDGGTTWSPDWTAIADGTDAGSDVADETAVTVSGLANGTVHTFAVRALNANGNGTTADGTATPATTVTVTVAAAAGAYGHELDQVEYTLTRTGATAGTLTVNVTMTQEQPYLGTAHLSQQVAFSAGATTAGLSFQSFQYQPGGATQSGNLTATVATGTGYNVGTPASASTRMVVLDPAVKVRLERASYRFEEGAGGAQVVLVARTEPGLPRPNRTFQVSLLSRAQTASSGTDYTSLTESVDILAADFVAVGNVWEARKGVAVVIADDATDESDETFDVYLSAGTALPARAHVVRADGTACPSTTGGAACASTATIVDDDGTPAAVRNLSFMPADGAVAVSWELPSDDGGSAVTGLQYRVSGDGGTTWSPDWTAIADGTDAGSDAADETAVTVSRLPNAVEHTFAVRALNANGNGAEASGTATPAGATPPTTVVEPMEFDVPQMTTVHVESAAATRVSVTAGNLGGGALEVTEDMLADELEVEVEQGPLTGTGVMVPLALRSRVVMMVAVSDDSAAMSAPAPPGTRTPANQKVAEIDAPSGTIVCLPYDRFRSGDPVLYRFDGSRWESASVTDQYVSGGKVCGTVSRTSPFTHFRTIVPRQSPGTNTAATGVPAISGTAMVGEALTAVTSGIADANGKTNAERGDAGYAFTYRWVRVDSSDNETDIPMATGSMYTLAAADQGNRIKVKVRFTDDAGNAEGPLTSAVYPTSGTVAAAMAGSCAVPSLADRTLVWTGVVTVAMETLGSDTAYGYFSSGGSSAGGLSDTTFSVGTNNYMIDDVFVMDTGTNIGRILFGLTAALDDADKALLRLHVCNSGFDFSASTITRLNHFYPLGSLNSLDWSSVTTRTLYLSVPSTANSRATGAPAISGTARVGETLTAATTDIGDTNGLSTVSYSYQWIQVDGSDETEISGETGSTYVLRAADEGKSIKVKVSFQDDDGHDEERPSAAYPTVGTVQPVGAVTIRATDATVDEGDDTEFVFGLSAAAPGAGLTVSFTVAHQDFVTGRPHVASAQRGERTVSFAANATTTTVTIPTIDVDDLVSADSELRVTLTDGQGYSVGTPDEAVVTITDTTVATVSFAGGCAPRDVTEADGSIGFTLRVDPDVGFAFGIGFSTRNGTASAGSDYTDTASTLPFAALARTAGVQQVPILQDAELEATEDFDVVLARSGGLDEDIVIDRCTGSLSGTASSVQVDIADDDEAVLLLAAPAQVDEGDAIEVTVTAQDATCPIPFAFSVTVTPSGDTDGLDDAAVQTVDFIGCEESDVASFDTTNDLRKSADRSLTFTVAAPTSADSRVSKVKLPAAATLDVRVQEDDVPAVSVTAAANLVTTESGGTANFEVVLATQPSANVTVTLTSSNTNEGTVSPGSLTFADTDFDMVRTVTVTGEDDDIDDGDQDYEIAFAVTSTDSDYHNYAITPVEVSNQDDEPTPSLSVDDVTVDESAGNVDVVVALSGASSRNVTVAWLASTETGDSAAAGADYTAAGAAVTVTIAAGNTATTVSVPILQDRIDEQDEFFTVTLSDAGPSGAVTIADATARVTITDDDAAPALQFTVSPLTIAENGRSTVTVSTGSGSTFADEQTIDLTLGGSATLTDDYTIGSTTLTLPAGSGSTTSTVTTTIDAVDDITDEEDETVTVDARHAGAALGTRQTITIEDDDDPPGVRVADTSADEGDLLSFTITVSPASGKQVLVNWATSLAADDTAELDYVPPAEGAPVRADDFTAVTETALTFEPGDTSRVVTVASLQDATDEFDETFSVTLTLPAGANATLARATARGTIVDDDPLPVLSIADASVDEGNPSPVNSDGQFFVPLTISPPSEKVARARTRTVMDPVYTASSSDWSTVTGFFRGVSAGSLFGQIEVPIVNDALDEDDETFAIEIYDADRATLDPDASRATITIIDDDEPPEASVAAARANEGDAIAFTVSLAAESGRELQVGWATSVAGGDSALQDDFTAAAGTLTFAAGDTAMNFTVETVEDDADEADETFTVTLSSVLNVNLAADAASAQGTIGNDDPDPVVRLLATPAAIRESDDTGESGDQHVSTVTATLDRPSGAQTVVTVAATPVTPAEAADFTLSSGVTLTFAPYTQASTGPVTLTAVDNDVDAPDKELTVSATVANDLGVTAPAAVTVTVLDEDPPPTPTLLLSGDTIRESDDAATMDVNEHQTTVTVELNHPSSDVTTVTLSPSEYFTMSDGGVLTVEAGETASTGTVTVTAVDNRTDAPDRVVTLTAAAANGHGVEQPDTVELTIEDEEDPPVVTLELAADRIGENGGSTTVTARLSHPSSEATTVAVAALETIPRAAEFTLTGADLTIPAGDEVSTSMATIAAVDNDTDAPDQVLTVYGTAANTQGYADHPESLELRITDDEDTPTVTLLLADLSIREANGTTQVTAELSHPSSEPTTITVTVAAVAPAVAADFQQTGSTLTVPEGETASEGVVTVAAVPNLVDAPDKQVEVTGTATNSQGTPADPPAVRLTIRDDDERGFVWVPEVLRMQELETAPFTVALSSEPTAEVVVEVERVLEKIRLAVGTTLGLDVPVYTLTFTPTNWSEGQTMVAYAQGGITSMNDGGTHGITHTATGGDYAAHVQHYTVIVTDAQRATQGVVLSVDPTTVAEGDGATAVAVTARLDGGALTSAVAVAVTVGAGTAAAEDFSASPDSFTLTIAANSVAASRTVILTPVDDALAETDETVTVSGTTAATREGSSTPLTVTGATITIEDDEARGVTIEPTRLQLDENSAGSYTVVLDSKPTDDVTVTPSLAGDAASLTVAPPSLTFTAINWGVPQTVTVTAAPDDDPLDATATVTHAVTGADYGANIVAAESVAVQVSDDDVREVLLAPTEVFLDEGKSTEYAVQLGSRPTGTVMVRLAVPNNPDVTVAPPRLDFTAANWNQEQTVTVAAQVDADSLQDLATVTHAVSGADYSANNIAGPDLSVTVTDVESTERIVLSASPDTVPEGVANRHVRVTATVEGAALAFATIVDVQILPGTAAATDFLADPATLRIGIPANRKTGSKDFLLNTIEDSDDEEDETVTVRGTSDFFTVTEATITIEDDDGVAFRVSRDTVTVAEDGTATYTVWLATRPTGQVMVRPSVQGNSDVTVSPPSLIFGPTTWETPQTVEVAAAHDPDGDDDMATVTHTGAGADYEGITGGTVAVTVNDDDATSTAVALAVEPTEVAEDGGTATVTVTAALNGAARAAPTEVAVTVAGATATAVTDFATVDGFTITILVDQTEATGSFALTPVNDDIDEGTGETLTVSGVATGLTMGSATLTITDDDERGIVTPETVAVAEQGSSDYTVALASEPTGEVEVRVTRLERVTDAVTVSPERLTFTAANWSQPQTVTVAAAHDDDGNDDTAHFSHRAYGADYAGVTADPPIMVTVTDNDPRGVSVVPTTLTLSEGREAIYTVVLLTRPTGTVTVTPRSVGDADVSVRPTSLQFNIGNWNRMSTVTVAAEQDFDQTADTATVRHEVTGADYEDNGVTADSVTVNVDDDDVPSTEIQLSVSPQRAAEGRTTQLTVTAELNASPEPAPVTVTLELQSGTAQVTTDFAQAAPVTLTIPLGQVRGTARVTLTTVDDDVDEDDGETVRIAATTASRFALSPAALEVTIEDDDARGVQVSPTSLNVTEGRPGVRYTVRLESQPTVPVTVSTSVIGDSEVSVQPASLSFTTEDWDTRQALTVTVAHDPDGDDEQATITHQASGGDYVAVEAVLTVNVNDDDETSTRVTLTVDPAEVAEDGGTATVTVTAALNGAARAAPTEVAVTVAGATATAVTDFATVNGFTITIPIGQTEATGDFRLTPVNDFLDEGSGETLTVSGVATGLTTSSATLTITDDDERGIEVTPSPVPVAEEGSSVYRVALASEPAGAVEVRVTVANNRDVTVSPERLTFTAVNWPQPQPVTVMAEHDDDGQDDEAELRHRASGSDYNSVTADPVTVTVTDNDPRGVQVTPTTLPVSEGLTAKYTVVLLTRPTGTVTVTPEVTDNTDVTVRPTSLQFSTGNWHRAQTVTVTAAQDLDQSDDVATVSHEVSGADYEVHGETADPVSVTVDDDDVPSTEIRLSVSPERVPEARRTLLTVTAQLNKAPEAAPVTVTIALQAGTALAPDDFAAVANVTLTIPMGARSGTRVLTLTPVSDEVDEDDETVRLSATTGASLALVPALLQVTIEDDDERGLELSRRSLTVTEEGSASTYTVRLTSQPTTPVTVFTTVTGDTEVSVRPPSLSFTTANWNTRQGLTVAAAHDPDGDGERAIITHRASGADYGAASAVALTVTVNDNDQRSTAVELELTPDQVTEDAGAQAVTVTVTLNGAVRAASTEVAVTVQPGSAVAADFNPAQTTVTIPAQTESASATLRFEPVADAVAERDETVRVRGEATGLGAGTATLTIIDDDERGLALVPDSLTFGEGGSVAYTVALTSQPTDTVRVDITRTGSPDVSLSTPVLTFAPGLWDRPQEVRVTARRDPDDDLDVAQLTHRSSGADYGSVSSVTLTVTVAERGVCHRSDAVEDVLMASLTERGPNLPNYLGDCDDVTDAMLAHIPSLYIGERAGTLTSLQPGDFAGLSGVEKLWITRQPGLQSLPAGVFEGLDSLQVLWLFDSSYTGQMRIDSIAAGAFRGLPELREIRLDGNLIEELQPGTFTGLNKLQALYIQNNRLQSIPLDELERLPRLGKGYEHWPTVAPDHHPNVGVWWAGNPGYAAGVELSPRSLEVKERFGTVRYRVRLRTPGDIVGHDPNSDDRTILHAVIQVNAPVGLTVQPAELTFTDKNWFRSQTVEVTDAGVVSGSLTITHAVEGPYGYRITDALTVAVKIEGTAPARAAVQVTAEPAVTDPGEDGAYAGGDRIAARVSFSDTVTVDTAGGTPALSLLLGEVVRAADYESGSGTAELVFALAVAEADAGAYRARAIANGLRLNGGAIRAAGGSAAVLDFGQPPRVARVTVAPDAGGDGSWSADEQLALTLTFSEPVTVNTDDGTPTVGLLLGGSAARQARYESGSGTRALRFAYPLAEADGTVTTVLVAPDSLALNGGAIRSTTGLAVNLEHVGTAVSGVAQPELAVDDAQVTEAAGATLQFAVRLSGTATQPVTVAWATADGTATAGADYEAGSGTLTFALGERAHTVAVQVLDDVHNEGSETLTVTLSEAVGARIGDGEATGTIQNTDPLPAAWLARFGRTAAEQVLEAVAQRIAAAPGGAAQASVAGRPLSVDQEAIERVSVDYVRAWSEQVQSGRLPAQPRTMTVADLLAGSSFNLPLRTAAGDAAAAGGGWGLWGRGGWSQFAGREDALKLDGDVATGVVGADYSHGAVRAGLALAYSAGRGTYDQEGAAEGTLTASLLSVHPYVGLTLHERLRLWGLLGYGLLGELELDPDPDTDEGAALRTVDLGLLMGALGARGTLLAAGPAGGLELAARGDALLLRIDSGAVDGLAASSAEVLRSRLLLEAAYRDIPLFGGTLTPALEVGVRYDGGDAERGAGLVVGGGVEYRLPAAGLSLSGRAQGLLLHEDAGFSEWGFGGALRFDPGVPGRGLALSVAPAWGAAARGAERVWAVPDVTLLAPGAAPPAGLSQLEAELSYGVPVLAERALLTPYVGLTHSAPDARRWRLGGRLHVAPGLSVSLDAVYHERAALHRAYALSLTGTVHS